MSAFRDLIARHSGVAPAAPVAATPAPGSVTLPPSVWSAEWRERPTEPARVGFRLLNTNELLAVQTAAARNCADMRDKGEDELIAAYNTEYVAEVLSVALCQVDDVTKPYFAMVQPNHVRTKITSGGLTRIWEAWLTLDALQTPVGDQADDAEVETIASMALDGSLFDGLDAESEAYVRRAFALVWKRIA